MRLLICIDDNRTNRSNRAGSAQERARGPTATNAWSGPISQVRYDWPDTQAVVAASAAPAAQTRVRFKCSMSQIRKVTVRALKMRVDIGQGQSSGRCTPVPPDLGHGGARSMNPATSPAVRAVRPLLSSGAAGQQTLARWQALGAQGLTALHVLTPPALPQRGGAVVPRAGAALVHAVPAFAGRELLRRWAKLKSPHLDRTMPRSARGRMWSGIRWPTRLDGGVVIDRTPDEGRQELRRATVACAVPAASRPLCGHENYSSPALSIASSRPHQDRAARPYLCQVVRRDEAEGGGVPGHDRAPTALLMRSLSGHDARRRFEGFPRPRRRLPACRREAQGTLAVTCCTHNIAREGGGEACLVWVPWAEADSWPRSVEADRWLRGASVARHTTSPDDAAAATSHAA